MKHEIDKYFLLKGKRVLVTGSSRGIGKAIAFALGKAGAHVFFHASKESERFSQTVDEAKQAGIVCDSFAADLTNQEAVEALMRKALPLDILVLNASQQSYMGIEDFSTEEFETEFNANLRSNFLMMQAALPGMKERRWGRIISIGSINQTKQSPRLAVYAATKSALVNLIQNCARSYAPYGITANNIAPGVIATDRNKAALDDPETVKLLLDKIPARRFGVAEDCAGLALLLASEAGSYITGADIPVAGGMQL